LQIEYQLLFEKENTKKLKYYIIAGESSGDMHAANLMKELKKSDSNADFRCWGGDKMQNQGGYIVKHYHDLAFMGFAEVLMNIKTILSNLSFCKSDITTYKPDVVILVDYPGFNLRIAKFAKLSGYKVFYYISPQIWAWKQSRIHQIKKYVDKVFCILPFEKDFYAKFNYHAEFTGHPLLDEIENLLEKKSTFTDFTTKHLLSEKPIIAILPGSRKQEIEAMLPVMLGICKHYPDYQFVIAGANSQKPEYYKPFLNYYSSVHFIYNNTYELLQHAHAALVTSGTATLETALFGVPQVVCYKANPISYIIARMLVKVKYISLVNLIMNEPIVTELIQGDFNSKKLKNELDTILFDNSKRNNMLQNMLRLKKTLGGSGASEKTARIMLKTLTS
jgi:lipid-A-disaccharide synthase